MMDFDIVKNGKGFNIRTGGVALSVNGEEILTDKILENLLNKQYPVGSKFIFPSGSENPASYVGGDWIKVASNVNLPLGTSAGFTKNSQNIKSLTPDGYFYWGTTTGKSFVLQVTDSTKLVTTANSSGLVNGVNAGIDLTAFKVDLTSVNNPILVDIWQRLS